MNELPVSPFALPLFSRILSPVAVALLLCMPQPIWATAASTTTALAVSANGTAATSVAAGSVVTLIATVKSAAVPVTSGSVNFCDAAAKSCADIHLLGTASLSASGTAQMKLVPGAGAHSYKAVFTGTLKDSTSSSAAAALSVELAGKYKTTTTISRAFGAGTYSLTAKVVGHGGMAAPTGKVAFIDTSAGDAVLGEAELGAATAGLTWAPGQLLKTDASPQSIVAADFSGDGKPGLAVADLVGETVNVFLGNGDGNFTAKPSLQTGSSPTFLAVGNFGGKPGLAVSNGLQNGVATVFAGNGDGTFTLEANPNAPSSPAGILVGDFNWDGIPDLAVAGGGDTGEVSVLLGKSAGGYLSPIPNSTASTPMSVAETDFGLVATNNLLKGSLTVLVSKGNGSFKPATEVAAGSHPAGVAVGDFNGDGHSDVAVANSGDDTISILLGNGAGTFSLKATVPVGRGPFGVAVGDFNQDGKADLAVSNKTDNTVTVLEGSGDGTFATAATLHVGTAPAFLAVADFNGDGVPDIAVANSKDNTVTVLLTQPTQTATATLAGVAPTAAGIHNIEAGYSGDATYSSSRSAPIALTPVVKTPVVTPVGGTYQKVETVSIKDATPDAAIYYALGNVNASTSSIKYAGPITIASTNTVKAIAVASGYVNSAMAKASYTIDLPTADTPTFKPIGGTYHAVQSVTIEDASSGVSIYYTTNGDTPTTTSQKYTKAIPVTTNETIRAIAAGTNYLRSKLASATYTLTFPAATPVIKPGTGKYSAPQQVTITDTTAKSTIYYTTNGEAPTSASTKYSGAIAVPLSESPQKIEAIAVAPGFIESAIASATYTITPLVATPAFNPKPGTYSNSTAVTISDSTANSTIYYTTNGKTPTTSSSKYTGTPIVVNSSETIEALAVSGGNDSLVATGVYTLTPGVAAPPTITTTLAQNGAVLVSLATTTLGNGSIYYTTDGSTPTSSSAVYLTPFLVASNLKVSAIAQVPGYANSPVSSQTFTLNIPSGTLVWSDEFTNTTGANAQPNPNVWTYDTGVACCGNNEWEDYCAWGSTNSPCNPSSPNTYVGTDGYLHIIARNPISGTPAPGNYTSARLKSQGLFSFQYGRFEARILLPEAQGLWPAGWLLGNNIATVNWPACGEQDVQERINAAGNPDWNAGSIHAVNLNGTAQYQFPAGQTAAQWHTYGMIWKKGTVQMYIDDPTKPYVTYKASDYAGTGAIWPFDAGQANFIILNLAVGGDWPGPPNASTPFPSQMLVDYVRVYAN